MEGEASTSGNVEQHDLLQGIDPGSRTSILLLEKLRFEKDIPGPVAEEVKPSSAPTSDKPVLPQFGVTTGIVLAERTAREEWQTEIKVSVQKDIQ